MRRLAWIWIAATCWLAAGTVPAAKGQGMLSRSETAVDSLLHPRLSRERPLCFDSVTTDMGVLHEDDAPATRHFGFTNGSGDTVAITRVGVGCHCLSASWTHGDIAPGGKGAVELTYNPENRPGLIDADAFVYVEGDGDEPVSRLTLTGEVKPEEGIWSRFRHTMGALRLKQRGVVFDELEREGMATERILCGNAGEQPLRLSAVLIPDYVTFRTEPEVIPPGSEADIVITVDAARIPFLQIAGNMTRQGGATQTERGVGGGDTLSVYLARPDAAIHDPNTPGMGSDGYGITIPVVVDGVAGRPSERTLTIRIDGINKDVEK